MRTRVFNLCVILLLAGLALPACTRTELTVAGFPPGELAVARPTLKINPRTEWILAGAPGGEGARWVSVSHEGERKLFLGVARTGGALELLPIEATHQEWMKGAAGAEDAITFHEDLQGIPLTGAVGILRAKNSAIEWLGAPPADRAGLVALSPSRMAAFDMVGAVVAAGVHEGGALVTRERVAMGDDQEFLLVVPDGVVSDTSLTVGWMSDGEPSWAKELGERFEVRALSARPGEDRAMHVPSVLRPIGLNAGVDVVAFERDGRVVFVSTEPADLMLGAGDLFPAALGDAVLEAHDMASAASIARAMLAAREGGALRGMYHSSRAVFSANGSKLAGELTSRSLMGDAGRTQWFLKDRTEGRDTLRAPSLYYLARAAASEGDAERARFFAQLARGVFQRWEGRARLLGLGRVSELEAMVAFHAGEDLEFSSQAALEAIKKYEGAGDLVATARAEILRAAIEDRRGQPEQAYVEAKRARSHAYYGHDLFATAEAELELAELYASRKRFDDANEVAGYGLARMLELENDAGANRARIVMSMIAQRQEPGSVTHSDFQALYERARELRDDRGMTSAAAALILAQGGESLEEMARYGVLLGDARGGYVATPSTGRISRAFASICAQGLMTHVEEPDARRRAELAASCERAVATHQISPSLVESWIARGWSDWMMGRDEQVAALLEQMKPVIDAGWVERNPETAIHARMLALVADSELPEGAPESARGEQLVDPKRVDEVLGILLRMDAARRAPFARELAYAMRARGQRAIEVRVLEVGAIHARAARQSELYGELLVAQFASLAEGGRLDELSKAIAKSEQETKSLTADVVAYRALYTMWLAHQMSESSRFAAAEKVYQEQINTRQPVEQMMLLNELARIMIEISQVESARAALERVEELEASLPQELSSSLDGRREAARALLYKATLALVEGDITEVFANASSASSLIAADPAPEAVAVRARALSLLGEYSSSATRRASVIEELEKMSLAQQPFGRYLVSRGTNQVGVVETARARARLLFVDGRSRESLSVLDALAVAGIAARGDRGRVACERGLYTVVSGELELGLELLRVCATSAGGVEAARARAWEALFTEGTLTVRLNGIGALFTNYDSFLSPREKARLEVIEEMGTNRPARDVEKLKLRFQKASSPAKQAGALAELVDELILSGRGDEARALLSERSGIFYEAEGEWPAKLVHLRARLHRANLRPDLIVSYLARALPELPVETPPATRAELRLLYAESALALGQWGVASKQLGHARIAAGDAQKKQKKKLTASITALSERFSLSPEDP